tara:strand:- start:493 stop:1296 length:804 start_codon:yes stop_codon:yes gene_type:complete
MKFIKSSVLLLLAIAILQSCGSSNTVYKIKEYPVDYNPQKVVNDFYDQDAKLGYTVLKDKDYLYINISTDKTASQLKLLQNGVTIFLDKSGKENKNAYLQYPVKTDAKVRMDHKSLRENKTVFLKAKIAGLKVDVLVVNGDSQEFVNRQLNDKGITTNITVTEEELYYQIKFPINYITTDNKTLPSMGIAIKGMETTRTSQPARTTSSVGKGGGGRGSGGGRGGRGGGGGRMGGGSKGSSTSQNQTRTQMDGMNSDIEIWFQVDLKQ